MININIEKAVKVNGDKSAFVSFPFNNEILNLMRGCQKRAWHPDNKQWEISLNDLHKVIPELMKWDINLTGEIEAEQKPIKIDFNFKTNPYQHQVEGFEFGLKYDKFLLADEMGLGKTKQAIDIAVAKKQQKAYKKCLIICGVNGLKYNWLNEIKIHSNEKAMVLGSRTNKKGKIVDGGTKEKMEDLNNLPEDVYFVITNIETLRAKEGSKKNNDLRYPLTEKIQDLKFDMIIIDEVHKAKNVMSQQGKNFLKLDAESKIAMTGTPLMNKPLDLYAPLKWLDYEKHSFWQFKNHYCVMGGYGGYEVVGYRNLGQLKEELNSIMLRRTKEEVLDLPEKIYSTEYVDMSNKQNKIYEEALSVILKDIDKIKLSPNPLAQLIRLRQATGYTGILSTSVKESAKLDRLEELVEDTIENGEKVIIFSNWTDMTDEIYKRLKKYNPAIITGEVKNRQYEQDKFMNDNSCKVIIGTISAMGTGLTLTAASTVIFTDSPWNKANKEQAIDRAHRIGTTKPVNIITLVTKDTIDERIEEIIEKKGMMADVLVDGKMALDKNIVDYLVS